MTRVSKPAAAAASLLISGVGGGLLSLTSTMFLQAVCAEDVGDDYYAKYNYDNYYRRDDDAYYNDATPSPEPTTPQPSPEPTTAAPARTSYWSDYSILPRRCVTYNEEDVIVFSAYENGSNQCSGRPADTYTVPVSTYISSYLDQLAAEAGYNYQMPDSAQYVECIQLDEGSYAKLGCEEGNKFGIAVNIFPDNACTVLDQDLSYEDVDIDISDLPTIQFKDCQACDAAISDDDQYAYNNNYDNNQQDADAPLCSALWTYREQCDKSCQRVGHVGFEISNGWNTADKVLLTVLSLFGIGVLFGIIRKRRTMSNKETLLEEAALSSAGLKLAHIVGMCVCMVVIIIVFGLLGIKSITWFLLLVLDTALFGYLMKLTVDSGMNVKIANTSAIGRTSLGMPSAEPADLGYNQWK